MYSTRINGALTVFQGLYEGNTGPENMEKIMYRFSPQRVYNPVLRDFSDMASAILEGHT